jgi:hypothetical protein
MGEGEVEVQRILLSNPESRAHGLQRFQPPFVRLRDICIWSIYQTTSHSLTRPIHRLRGRQNGPAASAFADGEHGTCERRRHERACNHAGGRTRANFQPELEPNSTSNRFICKHGVVQRRRVAKRSKKRKQALPVTPASALWQANIGPRQLKTGTLNRLPVPAYKSIIALDLNS